jgi:hypothetical protein
MKQAFYFFLCIPLDPEHVPLKQAHLTYQLTFIELQVITSQQTEIFVVNAVRISDQICIYLSHRRSIRDMRLHDKFVSSGLNGKDAFICCEL